ncbi:hypothetical protein [Streptacidiphilus melanogenes]|uniref:hypothetical protein n=1 Tax=Streptacidiphilus melanogenes TaxID=411235 RepID=UPI000AC0B334|nr:hypothetical protein [Streptacidiphilus melanogenes]
MIIAHISPRTGGKTTSVGWHSHALHERGHQVAAFEADYSRQLAEWDACAGGFPFPVLQLASPLFYKNAPHVMRPGQIGVVDCGHAEDHRTIVQSVLRVADLAILNTAPTIADIDRIERLPMDQLIDDVAVLRPDGKPPATWVLLNRTSAGAKPPTTTATICATAAGTCSPPPSPTPALRPVHAATRHGPRLRLRRTRHRDDPPRPAAPDRRPVVTPTDRSAPLRARTTDAAAVRSDATIPMAPTARPADLVITSELIPTPVDGRASGLLSEVELHDLGVCERAVENLATATWLAGKALQSIRDGKLYRHTHARFEDYVTERWEISERAAYQMIEEWPLAERLNQAYGKPVTASHIRALLPVTTRFGLDAATELYQQLRTRAQADGVRLTAQITGQIAKAVLRRAGQQAEHIEFTQAARQLITAQPSLAETRAERPRSGVTGDRLAVAAADPDLQNFAGHHAEITAVRPAAQPGPLIADNSGAAQAGPAAASSAPTDDRASSGELGAAPVTDPNLGTARTAVGLYRDIVSHILAIEQLAISPCLVPSGPDEEAEFDHLHVQITTRLTQILDSLTAEG